MNFIDIKCLVQMSRAFFYVRARAEEPTLSGLSAETIIFPCGHFFAGLIPEPSRNPARS